MRFVLACQLLVALCSVHAVISLTFTKKAVVPAALSRSMKMIATDRPNYSVPDIVETQILEGKMRPRPTDLGWAAVRDQLHQSFGMTEKGMFVCLFKSFVPYL